MKIRKILVFVLFVFVLVLSGCGSESTPEKLWGQFVKALNTKNIETVAEIYYVRESNDFNKFVELNDPEEYFNFESIQTLSFTPLIENDRYYSAEVEVDVDGYESTFDVYFVRDPNSPWRFIGEVDATAFELEKLGNKPDDAYYNNIIQNNGDFDYKYIYGTKPGVVSDKDYIKIVYPNSNAKSIIVPETIDDAPVTMIGDFAFFDYFRIFTVTFSKSKLEEIVLPSKLEIIDSYAFYQTKNLKTIDLPSSLKEIRNYAFASSGLEKLVINVDDKDAYANLTPKQGLDSMTINGDKVVYMGDGPIYSLAGKSNALVTWSTSDAEVATISTGGKVTPVKTGTVDVIAQLNTDPTYISKATIEIKAAEEKSKESSIPTDPIFKDFKFNVKNVYFTGEQITLNQSLQNIPATWTSSDSSVASFDGTKLTMVGAGTVTITATSVPNPNLKTSVTFTVKPLSEKSVKTTFSYEDFTFTGARNMFVGDYLKVTAEGFNESEIEWSTNNTAIATVGRYSGVITALGTGTVELRGQRTDNPNIVSVVTLQISEPVKGVTFLENSLDRLNNIQEIYINSINPNSIDIKGTLKLPTSVKIYVPAQNIETYKKHKVWTKFANNIYPIPEE